MENFKQNGQTENIVSAAADGATAAAQTVAEQTTANTAAVEAAVLPNGDLQTVLRYGDVFKYYTYHYYSNDEPDYWWGEMAISLSDDPSTGDEANFEINKNAININGVVTKVNLILTAKPGAVGYFEIDDEVYPLEEKTYVLDITDIYNKSSGMCSFAIYGDIRTYKNKLSMAGFYNTGDNAPKLVISYFENAKEYDEDNLPNIKEIALGERGVAHLNLNSGETVTEVCDCTVGSKIPVKISHMHKAGNGDGAFGLNWRLNLINQRLKASAYDQPADTKFRFTDSIGDHYAFNEKFYYYDTDGKKVFVDKNEVAIDYNVGLSYSGNKIYVHQTCNGNTLIAQTEDYIGSDLIEQRQNEQIQLEETVKSYEQALNNLVLLDFGGFNTTGQIVKRIGGLSEVDFEILTQEAAKHNYYAIVSESEALQFQSIIINEKHANEQITALLTSINGYWKVMKDSKAGSTEYENAKINKEEAEKQADQISEQLPEITKQKDFYIRQFKAVSPRNIESFTAYLRKKRELENYKRNVPINYLRDKEGIISGYNADGQLVCMFDGYGNTVSVEYDVDGKVLAVYEGESVAASFAYAGGLLESITDSRGRTVRYGYDSGKLTGITYPDGEKYAIKYSSNRIASVTTDSVQWKASYKDGKLATVMEKRLAPVSGTVWETGITYTDKSVTLEYSDGNSEKYEFDVLNRITLHRETDGARFKTDTAYVYETDETGRKITATVNADPNYTREVVTTEQYDDLNLLVLKTEGWQYISDTVKVKRETAYEYDLNSKLIKETCTEYKDNAGTVKENKYVTKYSYNAQGSLVLTESYVDGEENKTGKNFEKRVYNDGGNMLKCIRWNSLDSSSKFYEESEIGEDGQATADRSETGEVSAEYEYVNGSSVVNSVKYPNGSKLAYGRDPGSDLVTSITQSTESGECNQTDIVYENGLPVKVTSGNTVIGYTYEGTGRVKTVRVNGVYQSEYSYEDYKEMSPDDVQYYKKSQTLYVDGVSYKSVYLKEGSLNDDLHRMNANESYKIGSSTLYTKNYSYDGDLEYVTYISATTEKVTYTYDGYRRVTKAETTAGGVAKLTENYTYNAYGELTQKALTGAVTQTYTYTYKNTAARELNYITYGSYKFYPLSDVNGRNTGREIYNGTTKLAAEYITYRKVGDHATNMPATVWFGGGNTIKDSIKYKYDNCGNIIEIRENGHLTARYTYDSLNRLVREDNKTLNRTTLFTYDNNGNITERCEYAYTAKTGEELSELECTHYSYDYNGDRLISYNGESCVYDTAGNPTTYRGKAATWQYGTRLSQLGTTAFSYDGLGRRTAKGGITYTYDSDGRLLKQSNGLEFIYDNAGLIGVKYIGVQYFYRKDAQGNIIAILNASGTVVANYIYDAWGSHKVLNADGTDCESGIGVLNPFRYRGYYYDTETGLYYLQTRYYDPEVGRFISQDSIDYADPETINGLNLYAYCGNNPVNYVDPNGTAEWWQWLISGLQIVVGGILIATGVGAGFGATLVAGGTLGLITNTVGSAVGNAVGSMVNGWGAISTGISMFSYGVGGAIAGTLLCIVGGVTMAFGANELVSEAIGTNYVRDWMGGSLYDSLYVGFNIASAVGTVVGRFGMQMAGTSYGKAVSKTRPYSKIISKNNTYYYDGKGLPYWSQHNIGKVNQHWHTSLGRDKEHIWFYWEFLMKFIFRKW